ncbi:O-antigen ligase family protein [Paenibacillus sp. FSL L8-0436]|uniref:O-antigen ligase family protein n=1 Tax=Paenibacillus sp. FSL L8-0436 TaxID=2954686 RepID=UPI0031594116
MHSGMAERRLVAAMVFVGTGLVLAAVTAGVLLRGLFFAGEMYPFLTVWYLMCAVFPGLWLIAASLRGPSASLLSIYGNRRANRSAAALLLICPLAILALYGIHWHRGPLSAQGNLNELLRCGLYASFAFCAYYCAGHRWGARFLNAVWSLLGMLISISALLAVCGGLNLPFAIAYSTSTEVSATGARLGGLLEYPNAFGAVMAVFLLERLFALAACRDAAETDKKRGKVQWPDEGSAVRGAPVLPKEAYAGLGNTQGEREEGCETEEGRTRSSRGRARDENREEQHVSEDARTRCWLGRAYTEVMREERHVVEDKKLSSSRGRAYREVEQEKGREEDEQTLARTVALVEQEHGEPAAIISNAKLLLRMLPLFPYAAALLLSESRGAWLAAACASAAVLLWKRRLLAPLLAAGAAPLAAAALLYRQLARAGLAVEPLPGLLLLAGLWAGALLAGLWLYRRSISAAGGVRAAMLVLAAAGWTAAGTAVLVQVSERITGPSMTVAARGLYYRDAWKLAAEAPWLGRGGETWRYSYLAAQSRPYVGSQVHSGYLDFLLNLGIVGLAAVLLLLLAAGWVVGAAAPRLLPPLLVIALHAAVDFDWSYGLTWLLLFLLPALALAEVRQEAENSSGTTAVKAAPGIAVIPSAGGILSNAAVNKCLTASESGTRATFSAVTTGPDASYQARDFLPAAAHANSPGTKRFPRLLSRAQRLRLRLCHFVLNRRVRAATAAVCTGCLCLALSLLSFQLMKGAELHRVAAREPDPAGSIALLRQSLEWNPREPRAVVSLSRLLPDREAMDLLTGSLAYAPEDAAVQWEIAERSINGSNPGEALHWIRRSLKADVYNTAKRVKAIEGILDMSQRRLIAGDRAGGTASAAAGLDLLHQFRLQADSECRKGQQHNDRRFGFTAEAEALELRLRKVLAAAYSPVAEERRVSVQMPTAAY